MTDAEQKTWLAGVFDRAAPTYDRIGDEYHDHFGRRLVEEAAIGAGARVLDVACGRGAVLVPAVERAGRTGRVVGVDFSPAMVSASRAAVGDRAEVSEMDAEHLDLDSNSFDVVLCAFGVFFFPEPDRAIAEMFRVLVPDGCVALSSWTEPDERWAWEGALLGGLLVERRPTARPFDTVDDLEQVLRGAGFRDVRSSLVHHEVVFADEAEWWEWKWSFSVRGVLEQLDEDARQEYRDAAFAAMAPLREPRGFPMKLTAAFAFGRKAS